MKIVPKRGVSFSFELIIATVLGLVVLIVLIMIVTGNLGKSSNTLDLMGKCNSQGGFCARECNEGTYNGNLPCPKDVPNCCINYVKRDETKIIEEQE